jgi:Glycosyltransferase family 20
VWVHDYHLIPLAAELRAVGITNLIGYFHHIPWPLPRSSALFPAAASFCVPSWTTIWSGCTQSAMPTISVADGSHDPGIKHLVMQIVGGLTSCDQAQEDGAGSRRAKVRRILP